jgi:uncharacterized protein
MEKVYLIHGWGGNPNNCWFPWLQKNLTEIGFEVHALSMPNSDEPDVVTWPQTLKENISDPGLDTFFVGHSIGCQTIMRYLGLLPQNTKIGGVVFVAPFFKLLSLQTQEEKDIWSKWEQVSIDISQVKNKANHIVSIFSNDDPDVDYNANAPLFEKGLDSKIILEQNKGHFSDDDGIKELPVVLQEILRMSNI